MKKHHTPTSERVAIAEAVAERLKVQAEHRMKAGKAPCGNISTGSDEAGKTRDLAAAKAVAERLKGRQLANLKQNRGGNISTSDDVGKTRDLAAAKAGFGSGKTLEAAQAVIAKAVAERLKGRNHRPEKSGNISGLTDKGKTRDLAAAKAGFGSGKTLEAAQAVIAKGARKSDTSAKFS